ncbi:MAG: hypothetical protein JXD23_06525 [Spirochaetales bacterium]|nr:hypothetical protein [Spirochaetales bacterium]
MLKLPFRCLLLACGPRPPAPSGLPEPVGTRAPSAAPAPPPSGVVDMKEVIPGVELDVRYATVNNFTGPALDVEIR